MKAADLAGTKRRGIEHDQRPLDSPELALDPIGPQPLPARQLDLRHAIARFRQQRRIRTRHQTAHVTERRAIDLGLVGATIVALVVDERERSVCPEELLYALTKTGEQLGE